jgi:hypothetical protein
VAEVCDKQRPNWLPSDGALNAMDELIMMIASPVGIAITAITFFAIILPNRWLRIVALGSSALMMLQQITPYLLDEVHRGAIGEGCVGPPYLSIAASAAICMVMIRALRQRTAKGI